MNPKLKKIVPGVIVGALLLLGALAIYAILVGPSKEPYRSALAQYRNVYNANVAFSNSGAALNANAATDEQFEANIEKVKAALSSLKTENTALAKQEVLTSGEGKELYDSFNEKFKHYTAYNSNIINSIGSIRPVIYSCTQKMAAIDENTKGADEIRDCQVKLREMKDVPDADYRQMVDSFEAIYGEIAANIEQAAAPKEPEGTDAARHKALMNEREALLKELNAVSTTLSKNLQTQRAKVDITEAAIKLDKYLSAKSNIF